MSRSNQALAPVARATLPGTQAAIPGIIRRRAFASQLITGAHEAGDRNSPTPSGDYRGSFRLKRRAATVTNSSPTNG
jgi:hypothetical protein